MKQTKLPVINRLSNGGPVWFHNNGINFPTSEQRAEYVTHKLSKSSGYSPKFCYAISNIPFDDFTEHRENYLSNKCKSQIFLRRRDEMQFSKMPMESKSIYNIEYKIKENVKTNPIKPHKSQLDFVFNNEENISNINSSLYKSDFHIWEKDDIIKTVKYKDNTIDNQNAPTDYQENFNKKPSSKVIMPYPSYKKPIIPFASETSYNLTFIKHPYSKEPMIYPANSNLILENKPFLGKSLYKSDFTEKERDMNLDELNIHQNQSSFMQKIEHGPWFYSHPGQEFRDYRNHIFYQK